MCSNVVIGKFDCCDGRCSLEKHEEECIVGMDTSNINLSDCSMHSSQGPAVDMSGASKLCMNQGSITQCVGKVYRGCPAGDCTSVHTSTLYTSTTLYALQAGSGCGTIACAN